MDSPPELHSDPRLDSEEASNPASTNLDLRTGLDLNALAKQNTEEDPNVDINVDLASEPLSSAFLSRSTLNPGYSDAFRFELPVNTTSSNVLTQATLHSDLALDSDNTSETSARPSSPTPTSSGSEDLHETIVIHGIEVECTRSDIWDESGDILIHCRGRLFRVNWWTCLEQGLDLLNLPFEVWEGSSEDQSDVLIDFDDDPDEVDDFLRTLYLHDSFEQIFYIYESSIENTQDCWSVLFSLLRLGTKYSTQSIRTQAILLVLCGPFTSTLSIYRDLHNLSAFRLPSLYCIDGDTLVDAVNLFLETGAIVLLPSAMLECCARWHLDPQMYSQAIDRACLFAENRDWIKSGIPIVRASILQRVYHFIYSEEHVYGCQSCDYGTQTQSQIGWNLYRCPCILERRAWPTMDKTSLPYIPPVAELSGYDQLLVRLCEPCQKRGWELYEEGLREFWDSLPGIFDLGRDWEELMAISGLSCTNSNEHHAFSLDEAIAHPEFIGDTVSLVRSLHLPPAQEEMLLRIVSSPSGPSPSPL